MRPMQSKELKGKNLPMAKPRLDRDESLEHFRHIFKTYVGDISERKPDADEDTKFKFTVHNLIAEGDLVAMECESYIRNPQNNRVYNNFYIYWFRVKDGRLVLYKEYQDTLHMYDYLAD
jgi:ketosteroid isomerase-like protein